MEDFLRSDKPPPKQWIGFLCEYRYTIAIYTTDTAANLPLVHTSWKALRVVDWSVSYTL